MHMTAGGNWEWLMLLYCKHNISGPCNKSCAVLDTIGCLSSGNITQFTNSHDSQGFGQADQYLWSWTPLPPSQRVWCHQNVQPGAAPSTANATLTLWTRPKGIRAFAPKWSSVLKAEITVRKSENSCSRCQRHLSLLCQLQHILWGAILKLRHQQERQIPALWDSCFMIRIRGRIIYRNTKMLFSLIWWSLDPDFRIYETLCRQT